MTNRLDMEFTGEAFAGMIVVGWEMDKTVQQIEVHSGGVWECGRWYIRKERTNKL